MFSNKFLISLVSDQHKHSLIYDAFLLLEEKMTYSRIVLTSREIKQLVKYNSSIVLFDDINPDLIQKEIIESVREVYPHTYFIYFSNKFNSELFTNIVSKGIDYCIPYNQFTPTLLSLTFDNIVKRMDNIKKLNHTTISENDVTINLIDRKVWVKGELITLTPFEFTILKTLISEPNKFFTREELFKIVWTDLTGDNTGLVQQYIFKLRKKIGDHNIENKMNRGYRFKSLKNSENFDE